MATPQKGSTTPQSMRGNITGSVMKPYLKETRNLNDKNCTREMMQNVICFLSDSGYPEFISIKEMQKIDKQSFIKYFNFTYRFLDRTYQLAPRFSEEELMKRVKDIGYCGTLAKSALVSIGALHSTSQIVGLSSWLADLVRKIMYVQEESNFEQMELQIVTRSYEAWLIQQSYPWEEEFRALYMEKHQIEPGAVEEIKAETSAVVNEYQILEKKSSSEEDLKGEAIKLENMLEELNTKEVNLQQHFKEMQQEEKYNIQRLEEIREKNAATQHEISQLQEAAKNCKLSAVEARTIKAKIAATRSHIASSSEQRTEVAKLVENREMQLANISAEDMRCSRSLNVELMDMGITSDDNVDWKETLMEIFASKTKELSDTENRFLAFNEKKERILVDTSENTLKLTHNELQKKRLDEELLSLKTEREEMERLYLSLLAELGKTSAAPRSDPKNLRNQCDLDSLRKKLVEQKVLMDNQEKDLNKKMAEHALLLENAERDMKELTGKVQKHHTLLFAAFKQGIQAAQEGVLSLDEINALLPKPDY